MTSECSMPSHAAFGDFFDAFACPLEKILLPPPKSLTIVISVRLI